MVFDFSSPFSISKQKKQEGRKRIYFVHIVYSEKLFIEESEYTRAPYGFVVVAFVVGPMKFCLGRFVMFRSKLENHRRALEGR